nr:MAG TPA: hypothetical protein [Herelleviridae sp.]
MTQKKPGAPPRSREVAALMHSGVQNNPTASSRQQRHMNR